MTHIHMIGCGNMGSAMVQCWLEVNNALHITIVKPTPPDAALLAYTQLHYCADVKNAHNAPDFIILAVKPQMMGAVLPDVAQHYASGCYISIAAGLRFAWFAKYLGNAPLIRAMPNMPVRIGKGTTSLMNAPHTDDAAYTQCQQLFAQLGTVCLLDDEDLFDAATALAGSGPAYLYYFMECLINAGMAHGLTQQQALQLTLSMCEGAATIAASSDEAPDALRRAVTSKGGTTQAALDVMMQDDALNVLMHDAIAAAVARAKDL